MPGTENSAAYGAPPVTFSGPSTRSTALPMFITISFMSKVLLNALVGDGLRRAVGGLLQRPNDRALRERDLESVVSKTFGLGEDEVGPRGECLVTRCFPLE